MAEEEQPTPIYKYYGLDSNYDYSIYEGFNHCETNRFWRRSVGQLVEKYQNHDPMEIDECRNAYTPPREPQVLDLTSNLLFYSKEKGVHIRAPAE